MMARQKNAEPKPDLQEIKREVIKTLRDAEDIFNTSYLRKYQKLPDNHMINMRSAYTENHIFPVLKEETSDGFRIFHQLYLTKPLYRKIELLAQLKDQPFMTCLIELAADQLDAVLDNSDEIADLIKKRILEEAYGLGNESPVVREEKLKQAIIDEDPEKHR